MKFTNCCLPLFLSFFLINAFTFCNHKEKKTDSSSQESSTPIVYHVKISGAITPSTMEELHDAIKKASENRADALVVSMDTPGGLMVSMDEMIRDILASDVPVITYIGPAGATCGSAGVYILYASHVAAMADATNIGSATPVSTGGGEGTPGNEKKGDAIPEEAGSNDAVNLKRKILHHSIARIRSLAEYRNRNVRFAESSITHAENITSTEALKQGVIDLMADSITELLNKVDGRKVRMLDHSIVLHTKNATVIPIEKDTRNEILAIITNPNVAYIFLMIGMLGILGEIQYPGSIFPGVAGGISIIIGLYAMQTLPVNYAGLALLLLGMLFFIIEIFTPSIGLFTTAGVISLLLGSFFLIDSAEEIHQISRLLIFGTVGTVSAIFFFMAYKAYQTLGMRPSSGQEALTGKRVRITEDVTDQTGRVFFDGEYWNARTRDGITLKAGTTANIVDREGLILYISVSLTDLTDS